MKEDQYSPSSSQMRKSKVEIIKPLSSGHRGPQQVVNWRLTQYPNLIFDIILKQFCQETHFEENNEWDNKAQSGQILKTAQRH